MGDFYTDRAWSPTGPRLHIMLRPSPGATAILERSHRHVLHAWSHVLRPVPEHHLHLTLAWLPAPLSREVAPQQRTEVERALQNYLAELPPLTALAENEITAAKIAKYGVRCAIKPREDFHPYAEAATVALRDVFGSDSVPEPRTDPHIALAYGTGGDVTHLKDPLIGLCDWIPLGKPNIVITDADTFTPGTEWANTITI